MSIRSSQSRARNDVEPKRDVDVIVLGAGAAGLAVARALQSGGREVRVLEQGERPGQSWWSRYQGLRLNTVRWLSDLPPSRMPSRYGRWPAREEWASYLERYAGPLDVRLDVSARRIEPRASGWRIDTDAGTMHSRFVVVATGHDRVPVIPDWQGRDGFEGRLMHSSEFRQAGDLRDQRILVVGTGNSGAEIATLLAAETSTEVQISVRTPPLILRRDIAGLPVTLLGELARVSPDPMIDWAGRLIHRLLWGISSASA